MLDRPALAALTSMSRVPPRSNLALFAFWPILLLRLVPLTFVPVRRVVLGHNRHRYRLYYGHALPPHYSVRL